MFVGCRQIRGNIRVFEHTPLLWRIYFYHSQLAGMLSPKIISLICNIRKHKNGIVRLWKCGRFVLPSDLTEVWIKRGRGEFNTHTKHTHAYILPSLSMWAVWKHFHTLHIYINQYMFKKKKRYLRIWIIWIWVASPHWREISECLPRRATFEPSISIIVPLWWGISKYLRTVPKYKG